MARCPGYRKALRYSEEACQLEPKNGNLLTTLGMAYYRAGNYEKALDTLLRSDAINKTERWRAHFENLAFLAMTHQQLGHTKEAQAELAWIPMVPKLVNKTRYTIQCASRRGLLV